MDHVIGGADGPTAIFLTSRFPLVPLLFGAAAILAIGMLIALFFKNR